MSDKKFKSYQTLQEQAIKQVQKYHQNLSIKKVPTYQQMRDIKQLSDDLVISECGKGKGILHLCCPTIWNEHIDKNLYSDKKHSQKQSLKQK